MIPRHKGEIPFLLLLLPFICGVFAGLSLLPQVSPGWLAGIFSLLCLIFILSNLTYKRFSLYRFRWMGGALTVLILFLAGWLLPVSRNELNAKNHFAKSPAKMLVVRITSEPVLKNGIGRFTAAVEENINGTNKAPVCGTLMVSIKDTAAIRLRYGDVLLMPANYKAVPPPLNPAEFNYKSYLANKSIHYQAFLYPGQYTLLGHNAGNPLIAASLSLRQQFVQKLKRNIPDTGAYSVASAMILGYRADLSSDIKEAYSKAGALYVLNVSGAQIAIIYLVLGFLLRFLDGFKYGKPIKVFIILLVVWYYALLTGFSVSVCRAAVMLSFVLVGKASIRYVNTLNILAISAFALLCYNPFYLAEAGFQLSFIAVAGALVLRPVVYCWLSVKNKYADWLWSLCSFSIAIQLAILPLCMLYFHQAPVYFLASNLFVIIPAALIIYAGLFYLLLPMVPVLSPALSTLTERSAIFMNKGLYFLAHAPGSSVDRIWISTGGCILLYLAIACLFCFWHWRKISWLRNALTCGLIFCVGTSFTGIIKMNSNEIVFLSLGKHYGIVFRNGHQGVVLTDLADTDKTYRYSVQPYLDSTGVDRPLICTLNQDIDQGWLKKRKNLVGFANKRVLVIDQSLNKTHFPQKEKVDDIYVTGNPPILPADIAADLIFTKIIFDGSNSDRLINSWIENGSKKGFNVIVLKRNKSFSSVSN